MDSSQYQNSPQQSPGGGKSHICSKCGWNYPNPHPSAKNRRAHKKICGTIKGYELFDTEKAKPSLDLEKEHCFDDKSPSPRIMGKADERIGDISDEDVFADAVCDFSCSVVSDSSKEKDEIATDCKANSAKSPGETQQCNSSSSSCVMKSSGVVQESCEVPPVEVLENYDIPSSVEEASDNRQGGNSSGEGLSMASETLIESSQVAQVIDGDDTVLNVGSETERKENLPDESESKLAYPLGKREDTSNSSWNDDVIYSDVEGPHGFAFEVTSVIHPDEDDYIVKENVLVDTPPVTANAAQVISTSQSITSVENADVSLHGTKVSEECEPNHSVNPFLHETPKGDECETDSLGQAENLRIQRDTSSTGTEVASSYKLYIEDKTEPQGQSDLVAVEEVPSANNKMISKTDSEDIELKAEEGGSSFGAVQETVESETLIVSLPANADPIVVSSNADASRAASKTGVVDVVGHETELIHQANVVAEERSSPVSNLSSESSHDAENYLSPVYVAFEGGEASDQTKRSAETSKDSTPQIGAEARERNDEADKESSKRELVEEINSRNVTSGTAPDDTVRIADQKLLESGRTEFNRVVGGLGVIQGNEIAGNVREQNFYAEVPVTIESNDHRDFGRLQNLSEAQIRSLVSSPLVTRDNTTHAFESNLRSLSGISGGVNKPENRSEPSSSLAVALSKNQEITMEKTTSWSTVTEQHVPLKNLLNEARSPKLQQEAKNHHESNIPRVSSILGQETSPEDTRWPERREVSEEWNSPAKYPADLKRGERKVKGRPFWVPFVCCSSVN